MKTSRNNKRRGFTLIEMVGVLAVIAILAALLVPKIFAAINESRYNNTVASVNGIKTASMNYFGKFGNLGTVTNNYDQLLLGAGMIERPFATKIGTSWGVYLSPLGATNTFKLDGVNDITGANVAFIEIVGVDNNDAVELSQRIDGTTLSVAAGSADTLGRVTYANTYPTTVRIYLADK